jgi:hypothetical protein
MATKISTPVACGEFATFGVTTDLLEPYRYQWKRNGVHIGKNEKSYTTPPLRPEDFKAKYSVVVHGQDKTEESAEVLLSEVAMKPAAPVAKPPERRTGAQDTRPLPRAERRHGSPDTRVVGVSVQPPAVESQAAAGPGVPATYQAPVKQ